MILGELSIFELLFLIFVTLIFIIFLLKFKWFWEEIRDILKGLEWVIIFGQIIFVTLTWICFIIILFYFIKNEVQVNMLSVFLTILVGFLGTMIGIFFSESAVKSLKRTIVLQKSKIKRGKRYLLKKRIILKSLSEELLKEMKEKGII